MVEIVVGLVVGAIAGTAARVYVRYWHKDSAPAPRFEAFARGRPLVAAALCRAEPGAGPEPHGRADRAARELETLLGGLTAVCDAGRHPWPRYALELSLERPSRRVLAVRLAGASLRRVSGGPPDLLAALRALARECDYLEELWVHGELFDPGVPSAADRSRFGWLARPDDARELAPCPMIGAPAWLPQGARPPSPDLQQRTPVE